MKLADLSHFLQIWLFPPGLIILLMLIGTLLRFYNKMIGKILQISAFLILWLLSTPVLTQRLLDPLQNQFYPLSMHQLKRNKSAIIILGAGIDNAREYKNKHALSAMTFKRLHYAAHLYAYAKLPIIVSGGNKDNSADTEASLMSNTLAESYHIETAGEENKSRNTEDEANLIAPILVNADIHTIYLVTHAWHMPRSMYIFSKCLRSYHIEVVPAPTGYIALLSEDRFANYLPTLKALEASAYALHEYVGLVWYHAKEFIRKRA